MSIKAYYTSVWDGGYHIITNCQFDPETNEVFDIESVDGNDVEILEEQFVTLITGEVIRDFITEDGLVIVDGQEE